MIIVISYENIYAVKRLREEAKGLQVDIYVLDARIWFSRWNFVNKLKMWALYCRLQPTALFIRSCFPKYNEVHHFARFMSDRGVRVVDEKIAKERLEMSKVAYLRDLRNVGLISYDVDLLLDYSKSGVERYMAQHKLSFPIAMKWTYGFGQMGVRFVNDMQQTLKALAEFPIGEVFLMPYIVADCEYKVLVIGYKSVNTVLKVEFKHNKLGPNLLKSEPLPASKLPEVVALAEHTARFLGREVSKVDILSKDGKLTILEANRFPGFEYFETHTKENVAKKILEYVKTTKFTGA
ncbi:MAG TPA: hypothetical protein VEA59_03755 [Patescibacteria group bacterium]|nr:hypothetical protein [Patescibacteria group bacterium]